LVPIAERDEGLETDLVIDDRRRARTHTDAAERALLRVELEKAGGAADWQGIEHRARPAHPGARLDEVIVAEVEMVPCGGVDIVRMTAQRRIAQAGNRV